MKKISLIATTVLTGLLLFPSVNDTTTHAAEVTSHDAQAVAIQAMKNSGGNPDLQNFKKVKDKGDYFTIDINNKSGAGVGTYKVYKNG
ncbi:MAG: cell surface protein, partial [Staphylococcus epidermidis]